MAKFKVIWMRFTKKWPRLVFLSTFFFASILLAFSITAWIRSAPSQQTQNDSSIPTPESPAPTPVPIASPTSTTATGVSGEVPPQDEPSPADKAAQPSVPTAEASLKLIIPVAGIKANQLRDTFSEARSEGRVHNAIDIIAPRGAQVLAATDGKIVKLFNSERGGITIYQLSQDQKLVFYYAHLERYADGLSEGKVAKQGEVIGYVGDTGNAGAGNYHLHFALWGVTDPKRYWDGANINPYPLLRESR